PRERDQLAVEAVPAQLLEVAGPRPPRLQPGQVLLGREQLQDVELAGGEVAVPERGAPAGHHRRLLGRDAMPVELAAEERDPVLELVADLAQEGPEQKPLPGAGGAAERMLRRERPTADLELATSGG